jgi:cellulose synthase/poly-beta-1,6-N-acetylglucosamine synthase-like glycosyltransferase
MFNIAIIMSIYKNDKLPELKTALESLYNQTQKADIFLQLDGKVPSEIEEYLDRELEEENIKYLGKRDENKKLSYSLNELLEVVLKRGYRYIVRMDADDISVPTRIEKQVKFLESHPDIQAVGGWIEEFNVDSKERQIIRYGETHEELKQNLLKRNPLAHVTICFKNTFFDTISFYDTSKLNEDYDLWIKAFKKGLKLHCLQEVLVEVRTSDDFFARRKNIQRAKEVMMLKFDATKAFDFGIKGYIFAVAHFVLFLSPSWIKKFLYKYMRK